MLIRIAANILAPKGKGALQITSNVKAAVVLDNKPLGDTPLCLCDQNQTINDGEYKLIITPQDKNFEPWTTRIKINSQVLTAVERIFLPGSLASSYILTLDKTNSKDGQIFIASIPEGSLVLLDGEAKGITPLFIDPLSTSEHEIEIQKQGFAKKTVRVRAVPSYKLILNVVLGTKTGADEIEALTPTPTPSPTATPVAEENKVLIKNTPTGFLRVRENPSTGAREIGRVNPGETYEFVDENASWFKIKLNDELEGWISKTYAQKINPQ